MNENNILKTENLEEVSAGNAEAPGLKSRPLPGVTMPICIICGSDDTECDIIRENGKIYKQYRCNTCGEYFSERQEVTIPSEMQVRPR